MSARWPVFPRSRARSTAKQVTITFDEAKVNRVQIAEAMDEAGYPIAEASAGGARSFA